MALIQNTDLWHEFTVKENGQPLLSSQVEKIEFTVGDVTKIYPESEDVEATATDGVYRVRLRQEDTKNLPKKTLVQVRYKKTDGSVPATTVKEITVHACLGQEAL